MPSFACTPLAGPALEASPGWQAVARALRARRRPPNPDPFRISVTELLQPPRIRALAWQHARELYERPADAEREMWAMLGAGIHAVIAEALPDSSHGEQRLEARCGRWTVHGQRDLLTPVVDAMSYAITDHKSTFIPTQRYPPSRWKDWVTQLNLYAWLAREAAPADAPVAIVSAEVDVIYRDWKAKDGAAGVPPVEVYQAPVWSHEECQEVLDFRLAGHAEWLDHDEALPRCTRADTWGGARCAGYCDVARFCPVEERP